MYIFTMMSLKAVLNYYYQLLFQSQNAADNTQLTETRHRKLPLCQQKLARGDRGLH